MSYQLTNNSFGAGPTGAWLTSSFPEAGIWESGSGPAGDGTNVYFAIGNGSTTAAPDINENPCAACYGNSIVKVGGSPSGGTFSVADSFTPIDHPTRFCNDYDTGSAGAVLLPNTGLNPPNMLVQSGKEGNIYLLNTATGSMGGYGGTTGPFPCPAPATTGTDNVVQARYGDLCTTDINTNECGVQGSPVSWTNAGTTYAYFGPRCQPIKQYALTGGTTASLQPGNLTSVGGITGSTCNYTPGVPVFPYPGASLAISQYQGGGILWALDNHLFDLVLGHPPTLYAYDAVTLANIPLSSTSAGLGAGTGFSVKFAVPTVANGKVYVGNQSQLVVFSLNP